MRFKRIGYLLVSLLFPGVLSFGQTGTIDSLEHAYGLARTDSSRVQILKGISWEYINNRYNGDLAQQYIDSFYHLARRADLPWGVAFANYQYAVLERQKGNYSQALLFIEKYLDFWKEQGDENAMANGLYQKAIILDDIGGIEESLDIYYSILKIYEARGDSFSIANTLNNLGEVLKKTGKVEEAMDHYRRAFAIFQSLGKKVDMANCIYNLGDAHLLRKEYDLALEYFNKALALDRELQSEWGTAYDLESIGKVYGLKGNYAKALEYHEKALDLRRLLGQQRELAMSFHEIGVNQYRLQRYALAKENLLKAISITEAIGAKSELQQSYEAISKLFEAEGDLSNALNYRDKSISIKDSLFNETRSRQIEELQIRFDSEKKQAAIAALQKDAQITDLQLRRQKTFRNITIGIALAVILFSIILFNRYTYRQRVRKESEEKKRMILEEQQKTELEKRRVAELQKVDKLKDEFLANTSHELRTPLNGIIGLTEALKDGVAGKLQPGVLENLDMISSSGKRLAHLVNDILDFSKLKNKDLELTLKPVDIHAAANVVLKLSGTLIQGKELQLVNKIPKTVPLVNADENRLQQILHNLVGNAIKFTDRGKIQLEARETGKMLAISVTDTGIGIPADKIPVIFESFEQGDGSIQRLYGGTGLGLAVTRQLVELHGGKISVDSTPGEGATFTFTLPLSKEQMVLAEKQAREELVIPQLEETPENPDLDVAVEPLLAENADTHVLVVDDEPINRRVLQSHLTVAGYKVTEASSGREALDLLEGASTFNLILLDIMMPGMSGYEVCETLRKKYLPSELPVILLTAKNRVSDLVTGFSLGANDYLTKPFSKDELLSRMKTHLHLQGIHQATSRFVPAEFIKSVGREFITDVRLGDFTEKEVTVLFSDVRNYTALSESMTPQQNFKFVNAYVGKMGPVIQRHKGFVNQYLGDGIMALFPQNAKDGLLAAIEMQRAIQEYNERRVKEGYRPISVGMGLHTGPLVMGIIGDPSRNDTAIIADTVNTASRMEGVTKYYGANIIISEAGLKTIPDPSKFGFRYLGKVRVKGKDKAVEVYECFDGDEPRVRELKHKTLRDFEKGQKYFFSNSFPKAAAAFDKVLTQNPEDKVARYFVTKSAEFTISGVPDDTDMITILNEK